MSQSSKPFPWPIKTLPQKDFPKLIRNPVQKGNCKIVLHCRAYFIFWTIRNRTFLIFYHFCCSFAQKFTENSICTSKPFPKLDEIQNLSLDRCQGNKDKYLPLRVNRRFCFEMYFPLNILTFISKYTSPLIFPGDFMRM